MYEFTNTSKIVQNIGVGRYGSHIPHGQSKLFRDEIAEKMINDSGIIRMRDKGFLSWKKINENVVSVGDKKEIKLTEAPIPKIENPKTEETIVEINATIVNARENIDKIKSNKKNKKHK